MERYSLTSHARFNIAHQQRALIRTREGEREARWGLLAPWRGHGGKRGPMVFSATEDVIATTPMLRTARAKRRCLVLADGWFAWRTIDKKGSKKKQPYWIHAPAGIAFAGLMATHADDGVESFAIVMLPTPRAASNVTSPATGIGTSLATGIVTSLATGIVASLASEMPAIVDERWLESPELALVPMNDWRADAVSSRVDDVANDDAACVAPLGNPAQGELF